MFDFIKSKIIASSELKKSKNNIKFFASFKETPKFSLITKFSSTYISSNSR